MFSLSSRLEEKVGERRPLYGIPLSPLVPRGEREEFSGGGCTP